MPALGSGLPRVRGGPGSALLAGAVSAAATAAALRLLRARQPFGAAVWERANHAGRPVTLLEGPAYAIGAAGGVVLAGGGAGPVVAVVSAAGLGALDDHVGDASRKGLRGHLGALARGEVTTGAVKVIGLAAVGVLSAALADRRARPAYRIDRADRVSGPSVVDTLVGGAVVAGTANLVNLLDLRPGRALKATVLLGGLAAGSPGSAVAGGAAVGAALGALGPDLAGEAMLGDAGANSAGALVGTALVQRLGRRGRWVALALLSALTIASERVSFTQVIESTPVLRDLDAWGRG